MKIQNIIKAKEESINLATSPQKKRNNALKLIAQTLRKSKSLILKANKKDIDNAKRSNLSDSLLKRLELNPTKIDEMIQGIHGLINLDDPIGKTLSVMDLDKGLRLLKISSPIGVIGAIFESRPDALVQISCLCIKSGNAVLLKGGSEALNSNKTLFGLIQKAVKKAGLSTNLLYLLETREDVKKILELDKYIDLLVPRGSNEFVKYIMDNTKIPVLGHADGICHVYVDKNANTRKAVRISYDSKCQYAAVCNSMETLLVHKSIAKKFLPIIIKKYLKNNVELRVDDRVRRIVKNKQLKKATEEDWKTEYNDLILSIKIVDNLDQAIKHINKYGSGHTDSIVTENKESAKQFMDLVDSASVMWNASTRFSDGFRYGLGAEVGISTNKVHARGPVGLGGLTIYKFRLIGHGHVVEDYSGESAKRFLHRRIK
ncbi:MAG: glutamate-5-semialdehyde dehydrogenase [Candidatus Woesearchaeota archaeon]|jgi:glutamate-5-semialdehyde dehydrogenase|nr:glutamate-5-semialdehyde dehydrogenase [Candidatus Woesearchaeota archaeon]